MKEITINKKEFDDRAMRALFAHSDKMNEKAEAQGKKADPKMELLLSLYCVGLIGDISKELFGEEPKPGDDVTNGTCSCDCGACDINVKEDKENA